MSDHTIPIEIDDPALDAAALHQRVLDGISRRRQLAVERGLDFENLARGQLLMTATNEHWLKDLQLYQDKIHVHAALTPPPYTYLGFPMAILIRLKKEFHGLAAFYCNLLGERQILFNEKLVQILNVFSHSLESAESLADRVAELQQRVEILEQQLQKNDKH
jgi:hypothetical protein